MEISSELKEKIERFFSNNNTLMGKLLSLDPYAIEYIGRKAQSGIMPKRIIKAHKEGKMEDIYKEALIKDELEKLYKELLHAYYLQPDPQNNTKEER